MPAQESLNQPADPALVWDKALIHRGVSLSYIPTETLKAEAALRMQVFTLFLLRCCCIGTTGYLTDPRELGEAPSVTMPEEFIVNDNMIEAPATEAEGCRMLRFSRTKHQAFPCKTEALPEAELTAKVMLKVGDNITTDHIIMPAGAKILPYRSNIPHLSQYCFAVCDEEFP